jgi:hypothetical protein
MADIQCEDLPTFIATASNEGIKTVILAVRREYGQHPDPAAIRYERLLLVNLLAYANGKIIGCAIEGQEPAEITAHLSDAGFVVEERKRNIV